MGLGCTGCGGCGGRDEVAGLAAPMGCRVRAGLGRRDTWTNVLDGAGGRRRVGLHCVQGWRRVCEDVGRMLARYADDDEAVAQGGPWYCSQVAADDAPCDPGLARRPAPGLGAAPRSPALCVCLGPGLHGLCVGLW